MTDVNSQVRLYAIIARSSPWAVAFRRGPSKQVQLIRWNTETDELVHGQWFKGRIYERRCDLSPDGQLLIYFAAKNKKPMYSWTAVSRPPYLTALALWPNGAAWGGGGMFASSTQIELNHGPGQAVLAPELSLPRALRVRPFGGQPGWGEDDPVWSMRLERDGWRQTAFPTKTKDDFGAKVWIEFSPPITWEKKNPKNPKQYSLELEILGIKERGGPWWITEHSIFAKDDVINLGRSDWADWSHSGDLLYARDGRLFRLRCKGGHLLDMEESEEVADFRTSKFEPMEAPPEARKWPKLK